jgi:hypothetical protein
VSSPCCLPLFRNEFLNGKNAENRDQICIMYGQPNEPLTRSSEEEYGRKASDCE